MKAEDTFLSNGELSEIFGTPDFTEREGREKQSGVSFKAGREEEGKSWLQKTDSEKARDNFTQQIIERVRAQSLRERVEGDNQKAYECGVYNGKADGIAEGINEVVEWVNQHISLSDGVKVQGDVWIGKQLWQAFKKERGIE